MMSHYFIYLATILGLRDCEDRRSRYVRGNDDPYFHAEIDHSENGFSKLDEIEA